MTRDDLREIQRTVELTDRVIEALDGLSEEKAVRAIIYGIAARFDGPSFAKIVAELTSLQAFDAVGDAPYGNA
jgi:hypothetical protein